MKEEDTRRAHERAGRWYASAPPTKSRQSVHHAQRGVRRRRIFRAHGWRERVARNPTGCASQARLSSVRSHRSFPYRCGAAPEWRVLRTSSSADSLAGSRVLSRGAPRGRYDRSFDHRRQCTGSSAEIDAPAELADRSVEATSVPTGTQMGTGCKAQAAPATVSGVFAS